MTPLRLAREDVAEARIARGELRAARVAKQREHADGLAARLLQRARQNAVRNLRRRRAPVLQLVDDHRLAPHLRHRQQLPMGARDELIVRGGWPPRRAAARCPCPAR